MLQVVKKLDMSTPSPDLVDAYLTEIAKAYNVEWAPTRKSGQGDGSEGGVKVSTASGRTRFTRGIHVPHCVNTSVNCGCRSPLRIPKRVAANHMMRRGL
jgi:hypothetical protein